MRVCELGHAEEGVVEHETQQADESATTTAYAISGALMRALRRAASTDPTDEPAEVDDEHDDLRVGAVADEEEAEVAAPAGFVY